MQGWRWEWCPCVTVGWEQVVGRLYSSSSYCLRFQPDSEKCWNDTVFSPPHLPCLSRKMPPERMIQKRHSSYNSYTDATIGRFGGIFTNKRECLCTSSRLLIWFLLSFVALSMCTSRAFWIRKTALETLFFLIRPNSSDSVTKYKRQRGQNKVTFRSADDNNSDLDMTCYYSRVIKHMAVSLTSALQH